MGSSGQGRDLKEKIDEMAYIIWIDANINNEENTKYAKEIKSYKYFDLHCFNNVEESIEFIMSIRFEETFIIVSGRLYIPFIQKFKENQKNFFIIPKIVIFTRDKEKFLKSNEKYKDITDNNFYNSGIMISIEEVKKFLINKLEKEKINIKDENNLVFEYIDCKEKLLLPTLFKSLIQITSDDNIEKFSKKLCYKYKDCDSIRNLINSINNTQNIPNELLSKYYVRIYTDEKSKFYSNINKDLRENKRDEYLPYIKVLYEGLSLKSLSISSDNILYRGTKLANVEINKLKKYLDNKNKGLPGAIVFCKTFLSFSKDIEIAEEFLKGDNIKNLSKVLFILQKDEDMDECLLSNTDIEEISVFKKEREVLFFPFSSFEINDIQESDDYQDQVYIINLKYLGKYLKKFEEEEGREIPDSIFKKEFIQSGLIKRENIQNRNTRQLMNIYREYRNRINNNVNSSYIVGEIDIKENKEIRIINSYEEAKRSDNKFKIYGNDSEYNNEEEIKEKCQIKIDGEQIDFSYIHDFNIGKHKIEYIFRNNIIKADYMFYGCEYLIILDLSNFNTQDVTNMSSMFNGCNSLTNLNLANFNTQNVVDMSRMFFKCNSLQNLNLSHFNTQNLVNMSHMFDNCSALKSLNLSSFNTQKVNDMNHLFYGCKSLVDLNLSSFNTENVINMRSMFDDCNSLENIDLSKFNTQNVEYMDLMFFACDSLQSLNLSNFNTQKVNNLSCLFDGCNSLKNLDLSSFNTEKVTDMSCMFSCCFSLKNLNISNFDTRYVANMSRMFNECNSLETLDLNNFDTQYVTNMSRMFNACKSLKSLDLTNFHTERVTNMSNMFSECESLIDLNLSNFKTQNNTNLIDFFENCNSLKKENLICNDINIANLL